MQVASLWRYPVKGLSPEGLALAVLETGRGFAFDRVYAVTDGSFVFDPQAPAPMPKTRFLMLAKHERLALLTTRFDERTETLAVVHGRQRHVFDLGREQGRQALAKFLTEYLGVALPGQAAVAHAPGHQFTDVSVHSEAMMRSISLINLATVRDLSAHSGQALDALRFRANLYFDGAAPWSELDWVGRELRCGAVSLKVVKRTRRCPATSVDLERGVRDVNVPAAIQAYRAHTDCGIYAEVQGSGVIRPGDALLLGAGGT